MKTINERIEEKIIKNEYDTMLKIQDCEYLVKIKNFPLTCILNVNDKRKKYYAFFMELCDKSLLNLIKEKADSNSEVEFINILNWSKEIFLGLTYLHNKGLLHRDIKPGLFYYFNYNYI